MKKTKLSMLLSTLTLLSFIYVGCGEQTTSTENITAPSQTETETVTADTPVTDALAEATQENSDAEFVIPDYDYGEYLTASVDDNTPILGYNIPLGWIKNADSYPTSVTLSTDGNYEQSIDVSFNKLAPLMLKEIETQSNEKYVATELSSADTPIGTFRIFDLDYVEENYSNIQFALLPVTEDEGVAVRISYSYGNPHYYQDTMAVLLNDLFGEKQTPIEIPTNYAYYLQSNSGENILGVNLIDQFQYSESTLATSEYTTLLSFYYYDTDYHSIGIYEYVGLGSIYNGMNDTLEIGLTPEGEVGTYYYYTEKGTCETIYGTAKLYDRTSEINTGTDYGTMTGFDEIAILKINGHYVEITYSESTDNTPSNNIATVLEQLFAQ